MNRIIKTVYGIVLLCAILVVTGVFIEYRLFNYVLREELKKNISLEKELVALSVESELMVNAQVIEDAYSFLKFSDDDKTIRDYFKLLLDSEPIFTSIYYVDKNNNMINGSGWVPPSELDLRERIWYKKAISEGELIFTEAFLNASRDALIVTIAKPVPDGNGGFTGVIAGDMSIADIIDLVPSLSAFESSFSFMTDGEGNILAYPEIVVDPDKELVNIREISADLAGIILNNGTGLHDVEIDGVPGYISYRMIDGTNWKIGSFIKIEGNLLPERQMLPLYLAVILPVILLMIVIVFWQRSFIIRPILALDSDIRAISIETDIDYRLAAKKSDPFILLRQAVNKVLDKTSESFSKLKSSNEKISQTNQELSTAMLQLKMVETELRKQYESLYLSRAELKVSEELNRAIVSALPDTIMRLDVKGQILDCYLSHKDPMLENVRCLNDFMPDDVVAGFLARINETIKLKGIQTFDYQMTKGDKTEYFEVRFVCIRNSEVIAIIRDVTEERNSLKYIEFLSYNDQLSGLHNRRFFDEQLPKIDIPENLPISVMMLDVNGLKLANDAFGHHTGDRLLQEISGILRRNCSDNDMIVRSGGDEFVVVLPNTDNDAVSKLTAKIISDSSYLEVGGIPVSVSIGHCTKNILDQDISDTILKSEVELYRNKLVDSPAMKNRMIEKIMLLLRDQDRRESRHYDSVSELSYRIGTAMKLGSSQLNDLRTAALLHDIGKVAVLAGSENRSSDLDQPTTPGYRKHPETGYQILRSVDKFIPIAEDVLYHHETWDGKGFPRGLSGSRIPLNSRIIAVAEFYDACITGRSGLDAMSKDTAMEIIVQKAGIQFDPEVVEALQSISVNI